jgi:hypothetical protein
MGLLPKSLRIDVELFWRFFEETPSREGMVGDTTE